MTAVWHTYAYVCSDSVCVQVSSRDGGVCIYKFMCDGGYENMCTYVCDCVGECISNLCRTMYNPCNGSMYECMCGGDLECEYAF